MSAVGLEHSDKVTWSSAEDLRMYVVICYIPVVKQYIRCPDLVRGETEVFNSRIL